MSYQLSENINDYFVNKETLDVEESVKMLNWVKHLLKTNFSELENKNEEMINNSKKLKDLNNLKKEVVKFKDDFYSALDSKLSNQIYADQVFYAGINIDQWIKDIAWLNMEVNNKSLLEGRTIAIDKIVKVVDQLSNELPEEINKENTIQSIMKISSFPSLIESRRSSVNQDTKSSIKPH